MQFLCVLMDVNRSGFYKWRQRQDSPCQYEQDRRLLTQLLQEHHNRHPSYGYRRLAAVIRSETGWLFSDRLAHKCCKLAGIRSKARSYRYRKPGAEYVIYPNSINGNWGAGRPMELVVSDMTCIPHKGKLWEWVYMLDIFNNEIISHHLGRNRGDVFPYYQCLDALMQKTGGQEFPVILHTDQGTVYASRAFAKAHEGYPIQRSMSRAGTPTDNPAIESLNGWLKQEMRLDFNLRECDNLQGFLDEFVDYYNHQRPSYALNYKSPVQFRIEQGF